MKFNYKNCFTHKKEVRAKEKMCIKKKTELNNIQNKRKNMKENMVIGKTLYCIENVLLKIEKINERYKKK